MTSTELANVQNPELQALLGDAETALLAALDKQPLQLAEFAVALDAAVREDESGKLAEALRQNPATVRNAIMQAALLGLKPGKAFRHFSLVPFAGKVTGLIEWRGYVHLAQRAGVLASPVDCDVIYADHMKAGPNGLPSFRYNRSSREVQFDANPLDDNANTDPKNLVGVYATCKVRYKGNDGEAYTERATVVLNRADVEKRKALSNSPAWGKWPVEMWKKTAIRSLMTGGQVPLADATLRAMRATEELETLRPVAATVVEPTPEPTPQIAATKPDTQVEIFRLIWHRAGGDPIEKAKLVAGIEGKLGGRISALNEESAARLLQDLRAKAAGGGS